MSSCWRHVLLTLTALALTACTRSPDDGVVDAKRAYQEAVLAQADRYNPDALALASEALDAALAEIDRQNDTVMPLRDYGRARVLLERARQLARGARYEAVARRDQVRREAATILDVASREVDAFEEHRPASSKEWATWVRRLREASDSLTRAQLAFRDGDYASAQVEAMRLVEELRARDDAGSSS